MHEQMGVVLLQGFALFSSLAGYDWGAEYQVSHHNRFLGVVKREHVGRVVFMAIVTIQGLAFFGIHDAHSNFTIGIERVAQPTGDFVARQCCAVRRWVRQVRKLKR